MPEITYVADDGTATVVSGQVGVSIMQTAVDAGLRGIVGECGGAMMCATCHVMLDDEGAAYFGERSADEDDMLELAACEPTPTSRLSCQLKLREDTPDLLVRLPAKQI